VGRLLRQQRRLHKLTLGQVELATKIRGKYLRLLEADDTTELANDVYTRGFLRSYAEYLGLSGHDIVLQFEVQRGSLVSSPMARRSTLIKPRRLVYTPSLLIGVLVAAVLIAIVSYLGVQFSSLAGAPKLQVSQPNSDKVVYGSVLNINGHVDGGADVFVNDSPILSDSNGNFSGSIALQDGVNAIVVTAKSKLGKTSTVTRNILAHIVKTDPANSLPTAVFDGVAASVQISSRATAVTATADGKQIFSGTMLPGTTQVFRASSTLVLTTTDAGATSMTITNSLVASKTLGTLGQPGQTRTDLEFAKDTQFQ
jgi:cytoskeletal protein RodZ